MNDGEDIDAPPDLDSFESILDSACSRLWDRKLRYSLRRIQELSEILDKTERELDEMLFRGKASPPVFLSPGSVEAPSAEAAQAEKQPGQIRP
ncbi:MAG: hypothetical protein LBQ46_11785 [Treponema sp.]|jgi:hypothetical protein|nr:hypothetical protein [Treponema sp.]